MVVNKKNKKNLGPVAVTAASLLVAVIVVAGFLYTAIIDETPITWAIYYGIIATLSYLNYFLLRVVWQNSALQSLRWKISRTLWAGTTLWLWIFGPIYFYFYANVDMLQMQWISLTVFTGVPFFGLLLVMAGLLLARPMLSYVDGNRSKESAKKAYDFSLRFPQLISVVSFIMAVSTYIMAGYLFQHFAGLPDLEYYKNLFAGSIVALILSAMFSMYFDMLLDEVRGQIQDDHPGATFKKRSITSRITPVIMTVTIGTVLLVAVITFTVSQHILTDAAKAHVLHEAGEIRAEHEAGGAQHAHAPNSDATFLVFNAHPPFEESDAHGFHGKEMSTLETLDFSAETIRYIDTNDDGALIDKRNNHVWVVFYTLSNGSTMLVLLSMETYFSIVLRDSLGLSFGWLFAIFVTAGLSIVVGRAFVSPLRSLYAMTKRTQKDTAITHNVSTADEFEVFADAFVEHANNSYDLQINLEDKVVQKTKDIQEQTRALDKKNSDLEKTKKAMLNLLEDLDTEKKKIEVTVRERTKELRQEKHKVDHIAQNMDTGAVLLDADGHVVFSNREAKRILHIIDHENPNTILLDELKKKFEDIAIENHLTKCLNGESSKIVDAESKGRIYELHFRCDLSEAESEHPVSFIWVKDVTEAKMLEHSKDDLVAIASHQLRTPLTITRGNVEMLLDESFGELTDKQKELLEDTELSTHRLIGLVNDMLNVTKITKGDIELTISEFDIGELTDRVITSLEPAAVKNEITLRKEVSDTTLMVRGDTDKVYQVVMNLIDNAIRYSRKGGEVTARFAEDGDTIQIIITDTGIGIPESEQEKMFSRFYRATNAQTHQSVGSGLGLYIARSMARQMDGDIWYESEEGVGTTMYMHLPKA